MALDRLLTCKAWYYVPTLFKSVLALFEKLLKYHWHVFGTLHVHQETIDHSRLHSRMIRHWSLGSETTAALCRVLLHQEIIPGTSESMATRERMITRSEFLKRQGSKVESHSSWLRSCRFGWSMANAPQHVLSSFDYMRMVSQREAPILSSKWN